MIFPATPPADHPAKIAIKRMSTRGLLILPRTTPQTKPITPPIGTAMDTLPALQSRNCQMLWAILMPAALPSNIKKTIIKRRGAKGGGGVAGVIPSPSESKPNCNPARR